MTAAADTAIAAEVPRRRARFIDIGGILLTTLTVIVASQLGMPVSTTHISIGAVFGVGFLRELLKVNYAKMEAVVRAGHQGADREEVEAYMQRFESAEVQEKKQMLADMKQRAKVRGLDGAVFDKGERRVERSPT